MRDMSENFRITASPNFVDVTCPKHRNRMIELKNGWVDVGWWCKQCKAPYELKLVKLQQWDQEVVDEQLKPILGR